jgi:tetratricopeptide (TPR) repeat protein
MKLTPIRASALAALASAAPAAAQYGYSQPSQPPPSVPQTDQAKQADSKKEGERQVRPSSRALKPLSELQAAIKSKDEAAIQTKLAAAQAVVSTNEDRFILAQLQLQRAADANDTASAMTAMDAMVATGILKPTEAGPLLKNLSGLRFNAKQYDEAAAVIDKRLQLDPNDVDAIGLLAETRNAQGRIPDAVAALQRGIQAQSAGGRKPDEAWLKRATALAYTAKLNNAPDLARQWVVAYPSPTSWRNSIAIFRNTTHPDVEGTLDLLRLMDATAALTEPNDYDLYATAAAQQGNYVEALSVLNRGIAAKRIDPASSQFSDTLSGLKAKPQATEADLVDALKSASTAKSLIGIGDRYYGLGNYAKAAETYRAALAKADADANVGNLHLGMALARAGDKAGAAAALGKVGGALAEVARYWLLYVQGRA